MEKFRVIHAVRIQSDNPNADDAYDYFQLTLSNSKGRMLTLVQDGKEEKSPIRVSTKYIKNVLRQDELPVADMTRRQLLRAVRGMSITGVIDLKKEGQDFIADKFTGLVNTGTKKDPVWKEAKAGAKYQVQETGHWINYRTEPLFQVEEEVGNRIDVEIHNAQRATSTLENQVAE